MLRLGLACLTLAASGTPAYALPSADPIVAVSVEQRAPATRCRAIDPVVQAEQAAAGEALFPARAWRPGRIREARSPSPPRRLFLAHRALLR